MKRLSYMVLFQLAICAVLLLYLPLLDSCTPPSPRSSPFPQLPPSPQMPRLSVSVDLNQAYYYQGQLVEISCRFENIGHKIIQFDTFPPGITISNPLSYPGITFRKFPGGTASKTLSPGETATFTIVWDQLDEEGQQVSLGYYSVHLDNLNTSEQISEVAEYSSGRLLIGPEGTMLDKTVYLNESKTVNGIKFTLEKVEFTPFGTTIYALYLPIDYVAHSPTDIFAFYKIDDNVTQSAGKAKIDWLTDGMRFTWSNLEPVLKDAKDYMFSITGFNYNHENWRDPWQFRFSLR